MYYQTVTSDLDVFPGSRFKKKMQKQLEYRKKYREISENPKQNIDKTIKKKANNTKKSIIYVKSKKKARVS